jgi:hypothetical protein
MDEPWHESLAWPEAVVYSGSRSNPDYQMSAARRRAVETSMSIMSRCRSTHGSTGCVSANSILRLDLG